MASNKRDKMVWVSRVLALLCLAAILGIPIIISLIWLFGSELFLLSGEPKHYLIPHGVVFQVGLLTPLLRVVGLLVSMIPNAAVMLGLWHLRKLFGHFARLEFFTLDTVVHFRVFAASILLVGFLYPVSGAVMSFATSFNNSPGSRLIGITAGDAEVAMLFLGAVLFVIAWVMEQGKHIADENQQFI